MSIADIFGVILNIITIITTGDYIGHDGILEEDSAVYNLAYAIRGL